MLGEPDEDETMVLTGIFNISRLNPRRENFCSPEQLSTAILEASPCWHGQAAVVEYLPDICEHDGVPDQR